MPVQEMPAMQVQSFSWEDALEKEMATHSRILAWRIPWTEKPGRLWSTGSQRVEHNWSGLALAQWTIMEKNRKMYMYNSVTGKESTFNAGDLGSIPGLGRSPGEGHGNPFQYSCLENPHGQRSLESYSSWSRKGSDTTEWLSTETNTTF